MHDAGEEEVVADGLGRPKTPLASEVGRVLAPQQTRSRGEDGSSFKGTVREEVEGHDP